MQRLALVLFWAALPLSLIIASLPHPVSVPGNPDDKVQHVIAFAVLALLAALAYPRTNLFTLLLGLSAFGALIELAQAIPALNREPSWLDLAADIVSAAFVLGAVFAARRIYRRSPAF